jgi:hypothetical protein
MNTASLCSLAGRYGNPIPTRFLAPIDCTKILALLSYWLAKIHRLEESIPHNRYLGSLNVDKYGLCVIIISLSNSQLLICIIQYFLIYSEFCMVLDDFRQEGRYFEINNKKR